VEYGSDLALNRPRRRRIGLTATGRGVESWSKGLDVAANHAVQNPIEVAAQALAAAMLRLAMWTLAKPSQAKPAKRWEIGRAPLCVMAPCRCDDHACAAAVTVTFDRQRR
jgi:hypothetical protein